MTYGAPPVLGGVTLRRPTSVDEGGEPVGRGVELANGSLRGYRLGTRLTFSLSWGKLLEAEVEALRSVLSPKFTSYTHTDGKTYVVETNPPTVNAIAGTDPVRFAVSVELRTQDPVR